ncbi:MAG: glycosyltransferase family A protein [Psychroserpens sp.]|uniref:glycosyltransferase family 2 protein n=1 Tax=Psychroserpens sp. TaxID=2020870 RepID=UPI0030037CAB
MVFKFLKYIRPIWYFNLEPKKDFYYFPTFEDICYKGFKLEEDSNYLSQESKTYDLAWRAFQMGYINSNNGTGVFVWKNTNLPLSDEYHFIRKNFNKAWVYYVFLVRILTFKNPINEIKALIKTNKTTQENFANSHFKYSDYESFQSDLINSDPMVSVIIPTLNRYQYLKDVLGNLEQQNYKNFEVIVVDQTEAFNKDFYKGWNLDLHFWYQEEKALWKARNEAIKSSKGNYLLLFDDDSLIDSDWITNHLKCLDFFNADLSSGVSISKVGGKIPAHYSFFRVSDQLDTGNVLIKKEVFEHIGLFDRQFEKQRMGDSEFGLRAYLNGFLNISNPYAKRLHLKVGTGGLREMGSWDAFRNRKWLDPRPIPSVLYLFRKYFGNNNAKRALFKTIPFSIMPYQFKKNKFLQVLGLFLSFFLIPIILFQVYKSWRLSSIKLKQGALIDNLN